METRSKRKQQDREAAAIAAPIETRAQKAARIVSETQAPVLELPQARKRKQTSPQGAAARPTRRQTHREERGLTSRLNEAEHIYEQADKKAQAPQGGRGESKPLARADQGGGMDRHKRESRKGLDEAAREAEQVRA